MNIYKKILLTLLAVGAASCVCFTACDNGGDSGNDDGNSGTPEHTHEWVLKHDDDNHWYECEADGEKKDIEAHIDEKNNQTDAAGADGKCDVCGADVVIQEPDGSKENPIIIREEGMLKAELQAGQTLYYRLTLLAAPNGYHYRAYSIDPNALFTSGKNSGSDIQLVMSGLRYEFSLKAADGKASEFYISVELAEDSKPGETPTNPLNVNEGENEVNVAVGATVYLRFRTRMVEAESMYYKVLSDNENALFSSGENTGAEVRLVPDAENKYLYDFSLTVKDGKAATVKLTIKPFGDPGTEYNPYSAQLGENNLHLTEAGRTVHYNFTATQTGFYVVTSACSELSALESSGLEPELFNNFKIIYYAKEGSGFSLSFTLSETFEGNPEELTFNIALDGGHGDGTQNNPYKLKIGDVCVFGLSDKECVYITVVGENGEGVAAMLHSPNTTAVFNGEYKLDLADGLVGTAVSVEMGFGSPVFAVRAPE